METTELIKMLSRGKNICHQFKESMKNPRAVTDPVRDKPRRSGRGRIARTA